MPVAQQLPVVRLPDDNVMGLGVPHHKSLAIEQLARAQGQGFKIRLPDRTAKALSIVLDSFLVEIKRASRVITGRRFLCSPTSRVKGETP